MNTQNNDESRYFPANIKEAAIVAAGPSLDMQIQQLAECKKRGVFIISSDTVLGALMHNGIEPDTVVSIDCQYKSYYHFLGCNLRDIPLVLDIASPPMLSGLTSAPLFFASGHPLAQYLCANWRLLPQLDTSGGNVTYACFSLAELLGASAITLFGADFAYIKSQSYARGTYVLPYFEERQNRFKGLEAQSSVFLYRSPFLPAVPGQKYRETAQLRFYRERLEAKAGVRITPGWGSPIILPQRTQGNMQRTQSLLKCKISPCEFLKNYRDKIVDSNDQQILTTLLPYAAFIKHRNPELKTKDLIEETRKACIDEISLCLSALV